MKQNKYDKRESKYRAWFNEREKVFEKHFLSSGLLITTWSAVTGELDKIDKRYGLSDDNREVWNVLWNKIFLASPAIILTQNMTVIVVVKRFLLV